MEARASQGWCDGFQTKDQVYTMAITVRRLGVQKAAKAVWIWPSSIGRSSLDVFLVATLLASDMHIRLTSGEHGLGYGE